MKICLINNLFYPKARGGTEQVVQRIAEKLADLGNEVVVITSKEIGSDIRDQFGKINVIRFFSWNIFWIGNIEKYPAVIRIFWHFFDMFNIQSFLKIRKILKDEKPDLVVTHNLKGLGYLIPWAIKRSGIKYFHEIHDVQLAIPSGLLIKGSENSWPNNFFLTKIYEKINKKLFSFPDVVISPSSWLMDFYLRKNFFTNSKKLILQNPSPTIIASDQNHLPNECVNFLYVGQIEDHKGILFLLDVFKSGKLDNCKLIVVGDGSKRDDVQKIADEYPWIDFRGRLSNEDVMKLYNEVDITIVPSLCYENSPTVVYESLSQGVPVIASNAGGTGELIKRGSNGFTFEAGNKNDLLEKAQYCLYNFKKLNELKSQTVLSVKGCNIDNYISKFLEATK